MLDTPNAKTSVDKTSYQAELFSNRLIKRYKHLRKWAKRNNISCYRLYDRDIPEIPLVVDLFESATDFPGETGVIYLQIALYERPYDKPEDEEASWLTAMTHSASYALAIPEDRIILKTRKKQHGESQYERISDKHIQFVVKENNQHFQINLSDYLDTGLFFDHRPLREYIRSIAKDKTVLNLFCYTGSFSVYAASGKARIVDSVDLSTKYLDWAKRNMELNGFSKNEAYSYYACDVYTFLTLQANKDKKYDIIILDPPTFSNSKKTTTTLDINRDWAELVNLCIAHLTPEGTLFFSTNSRRLAFDDKLLKNAISIDITEKTIPEDFRNQKIHRCWEIKKQ